MVQAAQIGCSVAVRRLLAFPPAADGFGRYRQQPHAASSLSKEDLQDCLLEACTAGEYFEPRAGHRATAQFFIDMGANVERNSLAGSRERGFCRPIHHAAFHGNLGAVRALLDAGADVDARGQCGRVPLVYALLSETGPHTDIVSLLIHADCDLHAADAEGFTPIEYVLDMSDLAEDGFSECAPPSSRSLLRMGERIERSKVLLMNALHKQMVGLALAALPPKTHGAATCVAREDAASEGARLVLEHREQMARRLKDGSAPASGRKGHDAHEQKAKTRSLQFPCIQDERVLPRTVFV